MRSALLVLVVLCAACSSADEPARRQLNEPSGGFANVQPAPPDPGRVATGPPPADSRAVHILGDFEQLPTDTTWADELPAFDDDVATVASIACEFEADGCAIALLGNLAAGGVDVVNLEAAAALSTPINLSAAIATLEQSGVVVSGRDDVGAPTVEPTITTGAVAVAIHSINALEGSDFADLERAVVESEAVADAVITSLVWSDEDRRAPSADQVAVAEGLVDAGATAVIGSGSVHLQRVERIADGLVAFNLGYAATSRDEQLERDSGILRLVLDSPTESSCLLPATAGAEGPSLDTPTARWCG